MVDMHHHIVYGCDDGARSLEMSQAMLRLAAEQGVTDLICTSHTRPGEHDLNIERYLRHMDEMSGWLANEGIPLRLHTGSEIMFTLYTIERLRQGLVPTLNAGWNVLIEFLPGTPAPIIRQALRSVKDEGYQVVLAHVERYACFRDNDLLEDLKDELEIILQMNADTVLRSKGLFGDRFAKDCLRKGLIDIVASDAHNAQSRPCRLGEAHAFLAHTYGRDYADALCRTNPASLLGQ